MNESNLEFNDYPPRQVSSRTDRNCFSRAGASDKQILTLLILYIQAITKTLYIAARYAVEYVRFISPAYHEGISGKRLCQLTNREEVATLRHGNQQEVDSIHASLGLMDEKKVCYLDRIMNSQYRYTHGGVLGLCLVSLGDWLNDAYQSLRYQCSKREKGQVVN